MRSSLRTSAVVSATALLAGTALTLTAVPASAATDTVAPKIVSTTLATEQIVVPAQGTTDKVRFSVRATDNVGVETVLVGLFRRGELVKLPTGEEIVFPMARESGTARDGVYSSWIRQDRTDAVGSYTLRVLAFDKAENASSPAKIGTYQARFNTKLGLAVADRTVAADQPVLLSGSLRKVTAAGWAGYAGRQVIVQFRKAGTDTWKRVGKVTTAADGSFAKALAPAAGSYRVVFNGDNLNVATTSVARKVVVG